MTFKALQMANEQIENMKIKGKDYAPVNQRIKAFRMLYPNGSITTEIVHMDTEMVIIKATVTDDFGYVLGTGLAYEKEGASNINKTSYIENCETSAVGRALGMCGIGIDVSVASAEELLTALQQQEEFGKVSAAHVKTLETCIPKHGQTIENVCEYFGVKELKELTVKQFMILMNRMGENESKKVKLRQLVDPNNDISVIGLPDDLGDQK